MAFACSWGRAFLAFESWRLGAFEREGRRGKMLLVVSVVVSGSWRRRRMLGELESQCCREAYRGWGQGQGREGIAGQGSYKGWE